MIWPFSKLVVFDFIVKPNSRAFQNAKAGCNKISGYGITAQNAFFKVLFCYGGQLGQPVPLSLNLFMATALPRDRFT